MNLIIKMAWRNIFRHKSKSLIIGVILFLGALLMTVGNGVITGMNEGLHQRIVEDFCGDIVLASDKQESDNVFLDMMGKPTEVINNFPDIKKVLEKQSAVKNFLPIGKNMVMVLNEDGGSFDGAYVFGMDFERYRRMFPDNLEIIAGEFPLKTGGIMPTGGRRTLFMSTGQWFSCKDCPVDTIDMPEEAWQNIATIVPKREIIMMGMSQDNTTTDIRLGISAIARYKALNTILGNFILMDIESYRQTMGYITSGDLAAELTKDKQELLDMNVTDIDAMFSDADMMVDNNAPAQVKEKNVEIQPAKETAQKTDDSKGAYNLVLVKINPGSDLKQTTAALTAALKDAGTGVRAIPWNKAIGPVGSMAVLIKGALFVFVMFLFFVAIIIIINTLSMAALERTSEIGMMRAVGARKSFISGMFFTETSILSFFFGGAGIICGIIAVNAVSVFNISTKNDMLQLFYGGDRFNPFLTGTDIVLCLIQLILVTLIAVVYPLSIARKITPLDAIMRD
jgi:putative ABC transport system permease protein